MRHWLLPALLAVVSLLAGAFAWFEPGAVAPGGPPVPAAAPSAPVLSPRRAPEVFSTAIADGRLRAGLDAVLADPGLGEARRRSCLVVERDGHRVYEARPDERLIPASNLKILTAVAVLERIGPDVRLTTEVRRQGGDLWLVGGGDPLLATADYAASLRNQPQLVTPLEQLADAVRAAGVTEVGTVRGDETRYDRQRYIPTWRPTYVADSESGPASALTVNDGFSRWRPGRLAANTPATNAAGVFAALLQARGVRLTGGVGEGHAPDAAVVARLDSPPLREVVGQMLRESDNLTAELLVKELGVRSGGPGTTEAGLRVVRETLAAERLPVDHMAAVDGSGLDRADRASCSLLLAALGHAGDDGPVAAGLPVAARDGTLARRFEGHPAAGRLRAKTGSLAGVVGLSGWVDAVDIDDDDEADAADADADAAADGSEKDDDATQDDPHRLAFALLANELPRDVVGLRLQEAVAAVLARYPDAPRPEELAP